ALLALTLAFYWKLALTSQFTFLETPDLAYQVLPWWQMQARAMQRGVFPLWDPYQWAGQPVLGQMQPGAAFPPNWLLFLAPLQNGYLDLAWVHRYYVLMHFVAALFMYALCRELGSSRFASVVAGAAFSFGGYLGTVPWPVMFHGAMWISLAFLFFHRMVRCGRGLGAAANAALCGGAMGASLLSGHHQAPMFTALTFGGVFLYWAVVGRWEPGRGPAAAQGGRPTWLLGVVVLFAFLIGAAQLLPAWEYGSRAYRWVDLPHPVRMEEAVPYYAQYDKGIFPLSLLGTLFPKAHLTMDPFLGFVCLSFALFAVAAGWRLLRVRIYSVVALGALAYVAGHYSLLHGLIYTLAPLVNKARSPAHGIFVFQFAALTLTAQGIDLFFGPQEAAWARWRGRIRKALVTIGLAAWALLLWLAVRGRFESNPHDQVTLSALVALLLAAVLYGFERGRLTCRAARAWILLLLPFELSITSHFFISHRNDPKRALYLHQLRAHPGIVAFLKGQPGPFRFDVSSQTDFPANLGDWEGLESLRGYLASVSKGLYDFMAWDWNRASLLLNTVYVVGKEPTRPGQREVYVEPDGWKVFRNDDAFPRAWVVHAIRLARDASQAAEWFHRRDFDARRETILLAGGAAAPPGIEPCGGESTVEVTGHTLHRIRARASAACAGMVVFAEAHFPGWEAKVDGRPATVYAPFGALRGVAVPAGSHTIEMVYRPYSVYLGAALSALGLLGCAALAWFARRAAASR
ncbi:MAG: YfhO family protein, partial [Acidobacteria bacterium]|nr:YfhO family protein [Acidobacteriota bacterium]